jgi:hypothetical protein
MVKRKRGFYSGDLEPVLAEEAKRLHRSVSSVARDRLRSTYERGDIVSPYPGSKSTSPPPSTLIPTPTSDTPPSPKIPVPTMSGSISPAKIRIILTTESTAVHKTPVTKVPPQSSSPNLDLAMWHDFWFQAMRAELERQRLADELDRKVELEYVPAPTRSHQPRKLRVEKLPQVRLRHHRLPQFRLFHRR